MRQDLTLRVLAESSHKSASLDRLLSSFDHLAYLFRLLHSSTSSQTLRTNDSLLLKSLALPCLALALADLPRLDAELASDCSGNLASEANDSPEASTKPLAATLGIPSKADTNNAATATTTTGSTTTTSPVVSSVTSSPVMPTHSHTSALRSAVTPPSSIKELSQSKLCCSSNTNSFFASHGKESSPVVDETTQKNSDLSHFTI